MNTLLCDGKISIVGAIWLIDDERAWLLLHGYGL